MSTTTKTRLKPKKTEAPPTTRALELQAYEGASALHVVERPLPELKPGDVVVKVHAAPVNPSDLWFIRGMYGVKKPLPTVPGFEGAGVVVDGRGAGKKLVGRRVAFSASNDRDGTWAEYAVTRASRCYPLRSAVDLEQGAMIIVNPMTAWAFLHVARSGKQKAIVHTAAASALGRWLIRLNAAAPSRQRMKILHVVRRPEQVKLLADLGEKLVFDSSAPDFDARLKHACKEHDVKLAFDAVGADTAFRVLTALRPGGTLMSYGALSEGPLFVNPGDVIFADKTVKGLWLPRFLEGSTLKPMMKGAAVIQGEIGKGYTGAVQARVSLEELPAALERYAANMTDGKVLVMPHVNQA